MRTYTLYFSDHVSAMDAFDIVECEDEGEALNRAQALLMREPERRTVEVWRDARRVCRFERPAAGQGA